MINTTTKQDKMKAKRLFQNISFFIISCLCITCVQDGDYNIPTLNTEEPIVDGTIIQVDAVLGVLGQKTVEEGVNAKATFLNTNNYMEGYIVSSDRSGNFFEQLIIQDKSLNPTRGIRLLIDVNPLYTTYEFGRKVFVKLDGLSVGIENGMATLGVLSGNKVLKVPSFLQKEVLIRSLKTEAITPLEVSIEDFSDKLLNLYIKINNVQFTRRSIIGSDPLTFAAEPYDLFNGNRVIESCDTGGRSIVSTSTFSSFKGLKLSHKRGSFEGILSKNFYGNAFNLILNEPTGLVFDDTNRCDPNILVCSGDSGGNTEIFKENFTDLSAKNLKDKGWLNTNISGGDFDFRIGSFSGNKYAEITGYGSKEKYFEVWLITPIINLNSTVNEELSFEIQASYDNGNILTAFITNAFTGDATTTEWVQLDAIIPSGPSGGYGDFELVDPINISCVEGDVRIGFRYVGSDPSTTTRYNIDNIKITGGK